MGIVPFAQQPTSESVRAFLGRCVAQAGMPPKYLICDKGSQFWRAARKRWRRRGVGKGSEKGTGAFMLRLDRCGRSSAGGRGGRSVDSNASATRAILGMPAAQGEAGQMLRKHAPVPFIHPLSRSCPPLTPSTSIWRARRPTHLPTRCSSVARSCRMQFSGGTTPDGVFGRDTSTAIDRDTLP